jgi:hypothetical protein
MNEDSTRQITRCPEPRAPGGWRFRPSKPVFDLDGFFLACATPPPPNSNDEIEDRCSANIDWLAYPFLVLPVKKDIPDALDGLRECPWHDKGSSAQPFQLHFHPGSKITAC